MKYNLLFCIFLSGCATTTPLINPNVVTASSDILQDCDNYVKPTIGTIENLINVITENKLIYIECYKLNKAKKDFILRQKN